MRVGRAAGEIFASNYTQGFAAFDAVRLTLEGYIDAGPISIDAVTIEEIELHWNRRVVAPRFFSNDPDRWWGAAGPVAGSGAAPAAFLCDRCRQEEASQSCVRRARGPARRCRRRSWRSDTAERNAPAPAPAAPGYAPRAFRDGGVCRSCQYSEERVGRCEDGRYRCAPGAVNRPRTAPGNTKTRRTRSLPAFAPSAIRPGKRLSALHQYPGFCGNSFSTASICDCGIGRRAWCSRTNPAAAALRL